MNRKINLKNKNLRQSKGIKIFIVSGPGGVGKTTLVNNLFKIKTIKRKFIRGVSVTTRKKRPQEKNGREYFFISPEEFSRLKQKRFFLETQKVLADEYGTPKLFYLLAKKKNKGLILCIDVKGGMYLKNKVKPDKIITIFIDAPNKEELYKRMAEREETKKVMREKVKLAKKELKLSKNYDFVVINKDLKNTIRELESIVLAKCI